MREIELLEQGRKIEQAYKDGYIDAKKETAKDIFVGLSKTLSSCIPRDGFIMTEVKKLAKEYGVEI